VRTNIVNSQPEYDDVFGGLTRAQTVNQLYLNLFGRPAEPDGLNYWVNGGGATVPIDLLVFALSDGADATDRLVLDNKVTAAQYFTANTTLDIATDEAQFKAAAAIVIADVDGTSASVNAAKAMVDAGSYFVGDTIVLTAGPDTETGTDGNDTFLATNGTINSSDVLDGGAGNDTLEIRAEGAFNVAPSLTSIENITVKGSSVATGNMILDLSDSDGVNVLRSEENTGATSVQFRDIQDVNSTDIEIVDTDSVAHHYTYDVNAYDPLAPDVIDLYLSEVGERNVAGPVVSFGNTGAALGTGNSNVNQIDIVSDQRDQITDTTQNYLADLRVGSALQVVNITGTADLEIEDFLDVNVNVVNAGTLNGNLWLDLYAQDLLTITGAMKNDNIDIVGDGNSEINLGAGDDDLTIDGDGDQSITTAAGMDSVVIWGDGLKDIDTGADADYVYIDGDSDDLTTNGLDGVSTINTGSGVDYVEIYGNGDYDINLGSESDTLFAYGEEGNYDVTAGAGDDSVAIFMNTGNQIVDGGDGDDNITIIGTGDHTVDAGDDVDTVVIDVLGGAGNHDVDLGDGNDNLFIYGKGVPNKVGGLEERTIIQGGDGNDYVYVELDHRLTVDLGDDNDVLEMRARDLSVQDVISGGADIDTLILTNVGGNLQNGMVQASETDQTSSIEIFDLRNENITLELDNQIFETAQDNAVTVITESAEGTQTVDITRVDTNNYTFALLGGDTRDIVIANDETIDSFSTLRFDDTDILTADSVVDTLRVMDGATITEEDLENVSGLELIELLSNSNSPQTWTISLNSEIINQTTSDSDLVIRVGHNVPDGSVLNIEVDESQLGVLDNVIIERGSNVVVKINGQTITEAEFGSPVVTFDGGATITVITSLVFTPENDNLIGSSFVDNTFFAYSSADLNPGDHADGGGFYGEDWDTVEMHFGLSNDSATIMSQLNQPLFENIEELKFETELNVEATGLVNFNTIFSTYGQEQLENFAYNLQKITTGYSDDTLHSMTHGLAWDLRAGDDYLEVGSNYFGLGFGGYGEDGTSWIEGGAGYDVVVGGDGNDYLYLSNVEEVYGNNGEDTFNYNYGNGNDGDTYAYGGEDYDSAYLDNNGTNGTFYAYDVEHIHGGEDVDTIVARGEDDIYVNGEAGNDDIYVNTDDDADVYGGSGDDKITVYANDDADVFGGDGMDDIYVNAGGDIYVSGGDDNDDITVVSTSDEWYTDVHVHGDDGDDIINITADLANIEVYGDDGDDDITVNTNDDVYVYGGNGNDTILVNSFGEQDGDYAIVEGNDGDDDITVNTLAGDYSWIEGGAGNDTINLYTGQDGGEDTIVFGNIDYGFDQVIDEDSQGHDTITGFNFEDDNALDPAIDERDFLDFTSFLGLSPGSIWVENANWNDGLQESVSANSDIAVLVVSDSFVLSDANIDTISADGIIRIDDNGRAVVMLSRNNDENGLTDFEVYFVQDIDSGSGQTWAIDYVADIQASTAIGLSSVVDNLTAFGYNA